MGTSKHLLRLGDQTFLERIVGTLGSILPSLIVVAGRETELPPLPEGVTIIRDGEDFQGPLAGLAAGLRALPVSVEAAYLSGCDTPLLREEFVTAVIHSLGVNDEIAVPIGGDGREHPLAGAYRTSLLSRIEEMLLHGERRLTALLEFPRIARIPAESLRRVDRRLDSLRNINTPQDLAQLLAEIEKSR